MSQKTYCVYAHEFPNGKTYIGITCQRPESRWRGGKKYAYNSFVGRAIEKYGWENIAHNILFSNLSEQEAKRIEIDLIQERRTQNSKYGYNLTAGGDGMSGFKTRESTKRKLSEINTGKHHTEESKKKMSESRKGEKAYWYGKTLYDETKRKISIANKGKRTGELAYWYGKEVPKEMREKMSRNHCDVTGEKNPKARAVVQYDSLGSVVNRFQTIKQAAQHVGCNACTIRRYCTGVHKDKQGFIWCYAEEVKI